MDKRVSIIIGPSKLVSFSISSSWLANLLVLLPFIIIYAGTVFQTTHKEITSVSKVLAFLYMIGYIAYHRKLNSNLFLSTLIFLPFLIYGVFNSWIFKAGISDGIRYLFPIVVLFYSYSIKEHFALLLKFIVFFVVLNFLVQLLNYFNWYRGIEQWFYYHTSDGIPYYNETAGIIRATGTVVFFGFLGFLNMVAFFILNEYYEGRYKKLLLGITLFMLFASVSFKAFGAFIIVLLLYNYKRIYKLIFYFAVLILAIYLTFPSKINEFVQSLLLRISLYITDGDSARSESYRVMFKEIGNFNLFGQGVGVFGGPASTQYNSWYYKTVGFNWYDTAWLNLTTTDTFPPHLFVELGILGGLAYIFVLFIPLLRRKINKRYLLVLAIYFCLFFDMLFSFSLNNLDYLLFSLVFVYPILYYKVGKANDSETKISYES